MQKRTVSILAAALVAALTASPVRSADHSKARRAVVLTSDVGVEIDDQWMLAHLALSPEFDLRAVLTTHAGRRPTPILPDPAAESSARVGREVLDHLPLRRHPPVLAGSSFPLENRRVPRPNPAVRRLLHESRGFRPEHRLIVLVTGAATDTASALLLDPTLADRIEIVAMAFTQWPQGGDDFNVVNDPIAWQVLLDAKTPVTVGDFRVTARHLKLTSEQAHTLLGACGESGRYLAALLTAWLDRHGDLAKLVTNTYRGLFGSMPGDDHSSDSWPVWDEVVMAYMLGFTRSELYPRPELRDDLQFSKSSSPGSVIRWVTSIDENALWMDLSRRLNCPPQSR
ncbi:MAG: nucleoside hydrolase [Acidobacteria bacterium]|nr:nucleoside hydrolase [Acidobacteriota bacterium]